MLTVIAPRNSHASGQHHRQAVLDQFAKIIPTVLKEEVPRLRAPMVDRTARAREFSELWRLTRDRDD